MKKTLIRIMLVLSFVFGTVTPAFAKTAEPEGPSATVQQEPQPEPSPVPAPHAPAPAAAPSPQGCRNGETAYTVRAGDYLSTIAASFGTTVSAIKNRNGLSSDVIHPGQVLCVSGTPQATQTPSNNGGGNTETPAPAAAPSPQGCRNGETAYTVRAGNYLSTIAASFGTTVSAIKNRNGLSSDVIHPGQVLCVSGTPQATQTPPPPYRETQPTPESQWAWQSWGTLPDGRSVSVVSWSGTFAVAGTLVVADGPLPIGDGVAAIYIAGVLAYTIVVGNQAGLVSAPDWGSLKQGFLNVVGEGHVNQGERKDARIRTLEVIPQGPDGPEPTRCFQREHDGAVQLYFDLTQKIRCGGKDYVEGAFIFNGEYSTVAARKKPFDNFIEIPLNSPACVAAKAALAAIITACTLAP